MTADANELGIVVIGRNEGDRLKRCIRSILEQTAVPIVYVDSGSTDGSVEFARDVGANVVELDMSQPFTMARGRNRGFDWLVQHLPVLRWVQFVDGDCELEQGWLDRALQTLCQAADVAAVCGRRRERFPDASIFNRLVDMEWKGATGVVPATGGDAMFRASALEKAGRFNPRLIAGEEPELCFRLRRDGWRVLRLDVPMTIHDAAIHHPLQWWKRCVRCGYAYAEGVALHGRSAERYNVRQLLSAMVYGLALPTLLGGSAAAAAGGLWIVVIPLWGLCGIAFARAAWASYRTRRRLGDGPRRSAQYAAACLLGKVPEALGILRYAANRLRGAPARIIEYKQAAPPTRP